MTKKELLQKYFDEEMNEVFRCSANYRMDCPKKGCEGEWEEAMVRAEELRKLMEEENQ